MTANARLRQALAASSPDRTREFQLTCHELLDAGLFEELVAHLLPLAEGTGASNFTIWQLLGLAYRGLQDSAAACNAFRRAADLAPTDPLIAHSLARTSLEAGYPSAALFARARELAPRDSQVLLGEAAAVLADGDASGSRRSLGALLTEHPGWHDGHRALAKIVAMTDPQADRLASLRQALKRHGQDSTLWFRMIEIAMQGDDYRLALSLIEEARRAIGASSELVRAEAICRNESGDPQLAEALFQRLPEPANAAAYAHVLRNCIRLGRIEEAVRMADRQFPAEQEVHLWPYRALLWRLTGDERWQWLEGDPRLIGCYDISAELGPMDQLAEVLRTIHLGTGAPIDQSVRGGTQSDGNILARAEPEIRQLRAAMIEAVRSHIAQLPKPDLSHPTLAGRREPIRIEGAWSVRLMSQGHHVDHVHPLGWLSSAFYAALPEGPSGIDRSATAKDGWLTFGECRTLLPDFEAFRTIEPKVGTLALFPSTMWHGTRPFNSGERMTVALDVARLSQ